MVGCSAAEIVYVRRHKYSYRLGRQDLENPAAAYRRLRREMLAAERQVYVTARDTGEIDDEVLRRVLNELDLEEARLAARD